MTALVYYVLNGVVLHKEVTYNEGEDPVQIFMTEQGTSWDYGTIPDLHPPIPPHKHN